MGEPASRGTSDLEKRYPILELEGAAVLGIEKIPSVYPWDWISSLPYSIKPALDLESRDSYRVCRVSIELKLMYLLNKMVQWQMLINDFGAIIEYQPGKQDGDADSCLSAQA
ncbi:hypothetical protein Pelo_18044 [Pelomyxa schiedti]|nr:hypothetical protein Pelo_18044 [Pelomyxa schiedti]